MIVNNQQSVFAYKVRKKLVKNIDFLLEHEYNEIFHLNVDKGNIVYQIYIEWRRTPERR